MNMHLGLDNRLALPPFLPVLRNADGLFGQMLRVCLPRKLISYIPRAVLHLPGEQRSFSGELHERPRLADLLAPLVRSLAPPMWAIEPVRRMVPVGEGLVESGSMALEDFSQLLRSLWAAEASQCSTALEQLLEVYGHQPHFWAMAVANWIQQSRRCVLEDAWLVPADPWPRAAGLDAVALAQRVTRGYGQLLRSWPELRQQAGHLVDAGVGLARRQ
jgi:hypothetical protein